MKAIQIVSLPEAIVRRAAIADQFSRLGLDYELFDAIDGRGFAASEDGDVRADLAARILGRPMTGGEIGCALSHARLLRRFVDDRGLDRLVVFEDDVRLAPGFVEVLPVLLTAPLPDDCLVVFPSGFDFFPRRRGALPLHGHYSLRENVEATWGTYGMLLTREVATKLLGDCLPIVVPADYLGRVYGCYRPRVLGVWPPVLDHPHFELVPEHSSIGVERAAMESAVGAPRSPETTLHRWLSRVSRLAKQWL